MTPAGLSASQLTSQPGVGNHLGRGAGHLRDEDRKPAEKHPTCGIYFTFKYRRETRSSRVKSLTLNVVSGTLTCPSRVELCLGSHVKTYEPAGSRDPHVCHVIV